MEEKKEKGMIIGGSFSEIIIRQKNNTNLEIGELLIATDKKEDKKYLLQVTDLAYGSQISQINRELISGFELEENILLKTRNPHLRSYNLAALKTLLTIKNKKPSLSKEIPPIYSKVREIKEDDLNFIKKPNNPLYLGRLRSGKNTLNIPVFLNAKKVISHHILIPATTGRGKSNLIKVMLWNLAKEKNIGILVLDPHNEYYKEESLKNHPNKKNISYYTKEPLPGENSLLISIKEIKPQHLQGVINFSEAQEQTISLYYQRYKEDWIENLLIENENNNINAQEQTIAAIRRKIKYLLNIKIIEEENRLITEGPFKKDNSVLKQIIKELEEGKIVIIDTSKFYGNQELLIGSIIARELLNKQKKEEKENYYGIVLEEAPRVIGKEVLKEGPNVFGTIAREGRKFNIGLIAVTQLPSLIPKEILANMNTKIILGVEMKNEREAIINSAPQDLSKDDKNIAALDKGEAIITSNFTPFAIPIKIPLIKELKEEEKIEKPRNYVL